MADVSANLKDWSTTVGSNAPTDATTIGAGLADNFQQIQATVRGDLATKGADIAAAGTTDLGAVVGSFHDITGSSVSITSFGTVSAGIRKAIKFEGANTLTHNATSLITPGGASITTADGDTAEVISEGSGNWRVLSYAGRAAHHTTGNFSGAVTIAGTLTVSGTGPHAIGGATNAAVQLRLLGAFSSAGSAYGFDVVSTLSPGADGDGVGVIIDPTINEASSGTHADFVSLRVDAPIISGAAASLTNASTVKITGSPTGATNNYALWNVGNTRLDGHLTLNVGAELILTNAAGNSSAEIYNAAGSGARTINFLCGSEQVRITETASATRSITLTGSNGGAPAMGVSAGGLLDITCGVNLRATSVQLNLYPGASNVSEIVNRDGTDLNFYTNAASTLELRLSGTAGSSRLANGIRIGADSSNNLLDDATNGAGSATLFIGNASINVTSDERMKPGWHPTVRSGRSIIDAIEVIDHPWKEDSVYGYMNERGPFMGVRAQQVQPIAPWAVNKPKNDSDLWFVEHVHLIAPLIKDAQETHGEIDLLKARVADLEGQLARLN